MICQNTTANFCTHKIFLINLFNNIHTWIVQKSPAFSHFREEVKKLFFLGIFPKPLDPPPSVYLGIKMATKISHKVQEIFLNNTNFFSASLNDKSNIACHSSVFQFSVYFSLINCHSNELVSLFPKTTLIFLFLSPDQG